MLNIDKLKSELARRNLLEFVVQTSNDRYKVGIFHRDLCMRLDKFLIDVENGRRPVLIVSCPPRTGKSHIVSERFPLYCLGKRPDWEIVTAAYNTDLASKFSFRALELAKEPEFARIFPNVKLHADKQKQSHWNTTDGGSYKAVGVGSGLTGSGASVIVIDDPHKDMAEAMSFTKREAVWEWYTSTAYTRLADKDTGAGLIIVQTRWHPDDLAGRLLKKQREENCYDLSEVLYPAIATKDEYPIVEFEGNFIEDISQPPVRRIGEALQPERYDLSMLMIIKSQSEKVWEALYQQNPRPEGGRYIKVENFRYIVEKDLPKEASAIKWARGWDLAVKAGKSHDHSASCLLGSDRRGNLYVKQVTNWKKTWNENKKSIIAIAKAERIRIGIESVAAFHIAFVELRNELKGIVHIKEVKSNTDKFSRALPWIEKVEAGNVYLVCQSEEEYTSGIFNLTKWIPGFLEQLANFDPDVLNGEDDMCDSVTVAYDVLAVSKNRGVIV